jgi:cytochrome c
MSMTKIFAGAALILAALSGTAAAQDVSAGENVFKRCGPCHSVGDGARHKIGPLLNGLEGRTAGTMEGYSYSDANKNSGIVWNAEVFKEYIKDPRAKIPGTKMVFPGVKSEREIGDLWAYLRQFDAEGKVKSQ